MNAKHPYTVGLLSCALDSRRKKLPKPIPGSLSSLMQLTEGCAFRERCNEVIPECQERTPELIEVGPGHYVSCHRRVEKRG